MFVPDGIPSLKTFQEWMITKCEEKKIHIKVMRWSPLSKFYVLVGFFKTPEDAHLFADNIFCKEICNKVRTTFSPPLYPLIKLYFEFAPNESERDPNPINNIYQISIYPYEGEIKFEGKLNSDLMQKIASREEGFFRKVFQNIAENIDVLQKGLARFDIDLFHESMKKTEFTKKEAKNLLAIYRNLIDAWKLRQLDTDLKEEHCEALAKLISQYTLGYRKQKTVSTENYFIDVEEYVNHQLQHPDESNSFLLEINMKFGD